MRNWFIYNGKSTKDFGVYISGLNTYNAPERDVDVISVDGRNGDLLIDNGRYKNIDVVYPAFIYDEFSANIEGFRNFLLTQIGYKRLEDTYHPEEYRMARVKGELSVGAVETLEAGQFDITFDCKPQRFLKSGEHPIEVTEATQINNPTYNAAKPLLYVYGDGVFHIGDYDVEVEEHEYEYMIIDCDMMDAYYETHNLNGYISLGGKGFPQLETGVHGITMDNTISKIIVVPRWYII